MLLNETHLKPNKKFKIANYSVYRKDRLHNIGEGTAIIAKNSIKHIEYLLPDFNSTEACACLAYNNNHTPYLIVSVHKPPQKILNTAEIEYICNLGYPTIIAGDLNCKHPAWNSRFTNSNGIRLYNYMLNSAINIMATTDPTHISSHYNHTPDVLDILLTCNIPQIPDLTNLKKLDSDHTPIMFTLYNFIHYMPPNPTKVSWVDFKYILDNSISATTKMTTTNLIEDTTEKLNTKILEAINKATSNIEKKDYSLTHHIKEEIKKKNRLRKIWQRTRDPRDNANYKRAYYHVQKLVTDHKQDRWNDYVESLSHTDHSE
ncbi:uncharacterized protein LOC118197417 [Stegodyphus dumicola]|uniref:uncharacterized protein LOC118197417 n=1 Tax=Stegodyphus dumicola TaxID=202533 RepID=UPI0015AFB935|nr:uncharacterized protein LOC118197417 [Stegodyphus dumicola]